MAISLRQMRYAAALARHAHFGRAAEACAVSQPALSQQISALEDFCGTPLFDRLKGGVRLTPFGQRFVDMAQSTIESAEALDAFALGHGGSLDREVRFGLIPTVAPYFLPEVFPLLANSLTTTRFTISENRTEALIAGLVDGSLDIALIGTEPPEKGPKFVIRRLFNDPFVLATSVAEPLAKPIALDTLAPERFLLLDEGHCFRDQTIEACRLDRHANARAFSATSLSTIVELVANGQGITLLPQIALRKEAADARIAIHPIASSGPTPGRTLSLVWRASSLLTPVFERVAEVIQQHSRQVTAPAIGISARN